MAVVEAPVKADPRLIVPLDFPTADEARAVELAVRRARFWAKTAA